MSFILIKFLIQTSENQLSDLLYLLLLFDQLHTNDVFEVLIVVNTKDLSQNIDIDQSVFDG